MKDPSKSTLGDFFLIDPEERAAQSSKKIPTFFAFFKTIATKVSKSTLKPLRRKVKVKP